MVRSSVCSFSEGGTGDTRRVVGCVGEREEEVVETGVDVGEESFEAMERVTMRDGSAGASEKFREAGRSLRDEAADALEWSSTAKDFVDVRLALREVIDSDKLLPKVASVVVTTLSDS